MTTLRLPLAHGLPGRTDRVARVRDVTGADEARLAGDAALGTEVWVDDVLATVVTDLGGEPLTAADAARLTVGDRHALLLAAVATSYDPALDWTLTCPACGSVLEATLPIADLLTAPPTAEPEGLPTHRLPTGADLAAVAGLPPDTARAALLSACLGRPVTDADAEADADAAVENAMAAADPLAVITLSLECVDCGGSVPTAVDPTLELAERLADRRALLADVHALALAYGWTEPDVLALPRARRRDYLMLVAELAG